jgi:hypothetical protein
MPPNSILEEGFLFSPYPVMLKTQAFQIAFFIDVSAIKDHLVFQ